MSEDKELMETAMLLAEQMIPSQSVEASDRLTNEIRNIVNDRLPDIAKEAEDKLVSKMLHMFILHIRTSLVALGATNLASVLTVQEMKETIRFFNTPTGQKTRTVVPPDSDDVDMSDAVFEEIYNQAKEEEGL